MMGENKPNRSRRRARLVLAVAAAALFSAGGALGTAAARARVPAPEPVREGTATFQAVDAATGEPIRVRIIREGTGFYGASSTRPAGDRDGSSLWVRWEDRGPQRFTISSDGYAAERIVLADSTPGVTIVARLSRDAAGDPAASEGVRP